MQEIVQFLKDNPVQYLATIGLDNKPKVRPFQFMLEDNGKLYFCTNNQKPVYKEIKQHQFVELTTCTKDFSWLRLAGKAIFSNDSTIKEKILATQPLVKQIYQTASNPIFQIFYLDQAQAIIADFTGNPAKKYTL